MHRWGLSMIKAPYDGILETACSSKLLVTIPLWYRPARLIHLTEMIRTLAEFPVDTLDMIILTQTCDKNEIGVVERLVAPYQSTGKTFRVLPVPELADQFALCWEHRKIIKDIFLGSPKYTHFIYFEDDIRFSFLNFCYFLRYRQFLGDQGLIPSFVRIEYNADKFGFFSTDQPDLEQNIHRVVAINNDVTFFELQNPYCALYVLDQDLASEFVRSRSFDRDLSQSVTHWGIPERAAIGLCFENVPSGRSSRYAIPVANQTQLVSHWSWIHHLPNNFTNQTEQPWGQRRIESIFRPS